MATFQPIKDEPDLKCLECNYFKANFYMYENNTVYPNCGDQSCMSSFYWTHQMALREMEKDMYDMYLPTSNDVEEL